MKGIKIWFPNVSLHDLPIFIDDEGGGCDFDVAPGSGHLSSVVDGHLERYLA